jgi:SAM-dependent methyltransferase
MTAPRGVSGLLSGTVKAFRHRKALAFLRPGDCVLDVGSGLGEIVDRLPQGVEYTGVERDPWLCGKCRSRHPGRTFLQGDFLDLLPTLPGGRDAVLMLALLEHTPDPGALLRAGASLLRPGGLLLATTPSPWGERLHAFGARLRLLSSMASEEHHALLGRRAVEALAGGAGLASERYERFLLGLNQLFVFRKKSVK